MATIKLPDPVHDTDLFIKNVAVHVHSWRHGPYRFVFTMDAAPDGRFHVVTMDDDGSVIGPPIAYVTRDQAEQPAAERYAAMAHPEGRRITWSVPKE